jgi:hypothetical protein
MAKTVPVAATSKSGTRPIIPATGSWSNPTGPVVVADYVAKHDCQVIVYGGSSLFVAAGDAVTVGDDGVNAPLNNTIGQWRGSRFGLPARCNRPSRGPTHLLNVENPQARRSSAASDRHSGRLSGSVFMATRR